MTTRPPRPGERDGIDYIFLEKEEFIKRKKKNEFLEWAQVFDECYGTPKKYIDHLVTKGQDVVLNIDVQGAMKIRRTRSISSVCIFVLPPSMSELQGRLRNRSTETKKEIAKRMSIAKKEVAYLPRYDYVVMNNVLDSALENLRSIVIAERCRIGRR